MTIPSQLPQIVTAARTGALQALALQAGQVVDGRIVGAAPNGGTQVEIRGQMFNLLLPMPIRAGETVRFEVQGSGQHIRLALQPAGASPEAARPVPGQPSTIPQASPVQSGSAQTAPLPAPAGPVSMPAPAAMPAGAGPVQAVPLPVASSTPLPPGAPARAATAPMAPTVQSAPPAAPYPPTAAPMVAQPVPLAAATTGAPPPVPVVTAATTATGPVAPVTPATPAASATANPLPTPQAALAPPPLPASPQAALAQMVHASVPQQGAVTGLTVALTTIAGKVVLPEPVARAAQQVLAGRVAIDAPKFDGSTLQAAVKNSGIFQEASLARGQVPLPQADMKSALLALRQTLVTWLGPQGPVAAVAQIPPPLKGMVPRARSGSEAPPVDPLSPPEEVGRQLLERTESALARVRLHQHAALPDGVARTADWSMDLPVMIGPQQTMLQLQIHRDQHNEADPAAERGWQMRFAINLPGLGEVGAQVSLRAGATGVMLWASEAATSAALESEVGALRDMLAGAGLRPGSVIVRHGAPTVAAPQASGHFLDART